MIETDPIKPSQINKSLERDLETICLKCLEKAPGRRYVIEKFSFLGTPAGESAHAAEQAIAKESPLEQPR